jgi:hypothetical protein
VGVAIACRGLCCFPIPKVLDVLGVAVCVSYSVLCPSVRAAITFFKEPMFVLFFSNMSRLQPEWPEC